MPPIKTLSSRDFLSQTPSRKSSNNATKNRVATSSPVKRTTIVSPRTDEKSSRKTESKTGVSATHLTATQFLAAMKSTKPSRKKVTPKTKSSKATVSSSSLASKVSVEKSVRTSSTRSAPMQTIIDVPKTKPQKSLNSVKTIPKVEKSKTSIKTKAKTESPQSKTSKVSEAKTSQESLFARSHEDKSPVGTKAKRTRVPKDFAQTYGENVKERKVELPTKERRARKTAQQREQLRQLIAPDESILQRLSRVQSTIPKPQRISPRRTKKWESRCGKCGVVTTFTTNASLCSRCGAIAVRVLD